VTEKHGAEAATVASRLGWDSGLEILEATEPTLRRGHHLALVATEGSGVEAVYAFAVLQACEVDTREIQALVLCSTITQNDVGVWVSKKVRSGGSVELVGSIVWENRDPIVVDSFSEGVISRASGSDSNDIRR